MQLVGDPREGGAEVLPIANLRVAAARLLRDAREAGVGQVAQHRGPEPVRPDPRLRLPLAPAPHADGVDHHAVVARAVDDAGLAGTLPAGTDRAGVLPVTQHEDHAARLVLVVECVHRLVERAPERRGRAGNNHLRQRPPELPGISRERRIDGDLVPERADARHVVGAERQEEQVGGFAQEREVALHAARDVQHDDEPDRLRGAVEERDRLRFAFVAHLEVVTAERRDEPAVSIRHGDEDTDRVARAAEDGLLASRRAEHTKGTGGERSAGEEPRHAQDSSIHRPGIELHSYHKPSLSARPWGLAASAVAASA